MSAAIYSDLELVLSRPFAGAVNTYSVWFRFHGADDQGEQAQSLPFTLDPADAARWGPAEYDANLTAALFNDKVAGAFKSYRDQAIAKSNGTQAAALRVRITIDPGASELHGVQWERLLDPSLQPPAPLFMGERTIVSRFLSSSYDSQPIRLLAQGDLRALVVAANPKGLSGWDLDPVDVAGQLKLITDAASEAAQTAGASAKIAIDSLTPGGGVSVTAIGNKLRPGAGYDILYLVCHGMLSDEGPKLLLEDNKRTSGDEFVTMIRELAHRPRLIVLTSCQSAGKGLVDLSGLGPKLADAGIPAIIAMQGNISMETAADFNRRFFAELLLDGYIDRAVSLARGAVREKFDYWKPVLFMRLRNGRIWYNPGFAGEKQDVAWEAICTHIQSGEFAPIIGPELGEDTLGGGAELAARVAASANVPLPGHLRNDLAKVANYIATDQNYKTAQKLVLDAYVRQLAEHLGAPADTPIRDLAGLVVKRMQADPEDPFRILAGLRAAVYLNASYNPLLLYAIASCTDSGTPAVPEAILTQWRSVPADNKVSPPQPAKVAGPPRPANPSPTPDKPWDYHPFGMFPNLDSLVLTEDDFFDYLIAASRLKLILPDLLGRLQQSSLLFLGFRLDDWRFRVLFRILLSTEGRSQLSRYSHVGVQVNPDDSGDGDPARARQHLEDYFHRANPETCQLSVYWGSSSDFLRELKKQLAARKLTGQTAVTPDALDPDEWALPGMSHAG